MTSSKKNFTARLARGSDARDRMRREAIGAAVTPEEYLRVVEDYLIISLRRRQQRYPLFRLQLSILEDLVTYERTHSDLKKTMSDVQATDAEMANGIQLRMDQCRSVIRALRDVADGIAWRLFGYDRAVLSELADRTHKQHINTEGLEAELQELTRHFTEPAGLAILNDLTHFLKRGDLTLEKGPDQFEIVEVKASKVRSGSIVRQRQDLRTTVEFLTNGTRQDDAGTLTIRELPITPQNYVPEVRKLITRAGKTGIARAQVASHLVVTCVDFSKVAGEEDLVGASEWPECVKAWERARDIIIPSGSHDRYQLVRHHAPWAIYRLPEWDRVRLAAGALQIESVVNVSEVLRGFERAGWQIRLSAAEAASKGAEIEEYVGVRIAKGSLTIEVPWPLIGRLASEFLKPRTLVDLFDAIFAGSDRSPTTLLNLRGESSQWD